MLLTPPTQVVLTYLGQMVGVKNLKGKLQKQREELRKIDKQETFLDTMTGTAIDDVFDLALYYDPLDFKSQKTLALMNYYKVAFKRVI